LCATRKESIQVNSQEIRPGKDSINIAGKGSWLVRAGWCALAGAYVSCGGRQQAALCLLFAHSFVNQALREPAPHIADASAAWPALQ
jgi:hypothetical protein